MNSDVIIVSSKGARMDAALKEVEKVAAYKGLSHKGALHLRLLAEEMLGMMRSVAGDISGKFWIEDEDGTFRLHLAVKTDMDFMQREQLISAATSGKNEASRGIMGKIRAFFDPATEVPAYYQFMPDGEFTNLWWSLNDYRIGIGEEMKANKTGAADAWDELEKSVVSHVADEVKVSIRGRNAELIIYKKIV